MQFRAKVIPSGNATAVEVPVDVMKALGSGSRPLIAVTINGQTAGHDVGLRLQTARQRESCILEKRMLHSHLWTSIAIS